MKTVPKAIRLSDEEVQFMRQLLPHFPELRSDSDLQYQATMLGLWFMATAARRPGLPAFGGLEAADLAALIRPRVLAALDFLAERDELPRVFSVSSVITDGGAAVISDEPGDGAPEFDPEAVEGLAEFGSGFMDDD